MSFLSSLFGIKSDTVKPMAALTCERVYCASSRKYDTMYEVLPSGKLVKRGCCS